MSVPFRRSVALSLALCLLLMSGLFYAQAVPHTFHHAHHQAATHSTALCSWLCAAGQVLDGASVFIQTTSAPLGFMGRVIAAVPGSADRPFIPYRGPPAFSV